VLPTAETIAVSVATPEHLDRLIESLAGRSAAQQEAIDHRVGERFHMSERLVVAPTAGLFEPHAAVVGVVPGPLDRQKTPEPGNAVRIDVGSLIGFVGGTEVRSAFAGTLEGVLVLSGERVTAGQPVAWLRASTKEGW
jgi:[acyl-carrier-protein] S-malonyltransferase